MQGPPRIVRVQVPTPCVALEQVPAPPVLVAWDVWQATGNEWERARALKVDRMRLIEYTATVLDVLKACVLEVRNDAR